VPARGAGARVTGVHDRIVLIDVDNTLLDNDAVERDLRRHMTDAFGEECQQRYWEIFEERRAELGYADYLGSLQRFRVEHPRDPKILGISLYLLHYPFADRLYPGALDVIATLRRTDTVVVLSDGDVVFQPRKVERSGIWAAVEGRVLIYIHKEQMLDDVERHYPARHYVMVDDKIRLLAAMKEQWRDRLTSVFVRQGHYALDPRQVDPYPSADITLDSISELPPRL
jgi:FMN phosphatase YigB (HAD superfamily)